MQKKKLALSGDDQRAIDAVLNHAAVGRPAAVGEVAMPEKIGAVTKLLSLLDQFEVSEPPADMLHRTMQRIADTEHAQVGHRRQVQPIIQSTHFH